MSLKNQNSKKVGKGIAMVSNTPRPVRKRFEKVADEIKKKMQTSGVSGIVYTGIKEGDFSGGMVGDVEIIAETLLIACKRNAGLYHLLDIVVRATKDSGFHQEDEVNMEAVENAVEDAQEVGNIRKIGEYTEKIEEAVTKEAVKPESVGDFRGGGGNYPNKVKEAIEGEKPSKKK